MYTDEDIMKAVGQGNIRQAGSIYERYRDKIFTYFRRNGLDASISEDMTQEVFERMIKYRASYNADYAFAPWIYRIASNVRQDHYRQNKLHLHAISDDAVQLPQEESEVPQQVEDSRRLHAAIQSLPAEQKEILILCKLQKQKYAHVAQMMGTTETNIKTHVHRGIKKLRNYYQQQNWL